MTPPHRQCSTARHTLENHGYEWKQIDDSNAEAHEGAGEVKNKLFTIRLLANLQIKDDTLVVKSKSNGLGLVGATEHPAAMVIVSRKLGKCAKLLKSKLHEEGLA